MMEDESTHEPTKSTTAMKTSQAISALAHQTGIDDDVLTMLINKRHMDPSTRIHSDIFNTWSRESKQEWFKLSDTLKKDIVKGTQGTADKPALPRKAYYHEE